jgi:GABA permease
MRLPVTSESDAFRVAYGLSVLIGVSIALGAATEPLYGVVLCACVVIGAIAYDLGRPDPKRRRPLTEAAARAARAPDRGRRRVLVVANETLRGRELRDELLRRGPQRLDLRVIAPVLASRAHFLTSDIDRELAEARSRLDATLDWAATEGFDAAGRVGDMSPLMAIEDELRRYRPDELVISTHPPGRSNWLESGLVERVREQLDIPITHVVVDLERDAVRIVELEPAAV